MYAKLISPVDTIAQNALHVEIINNGHNVIAAKYPKEWVKLDENFDETESFSVPITVKSYRSESSPVYPGRDTNYIESYSVDVSTLSERQFKTLNRIVQGLWNQINGMTNLNDFRFGSEKHHIRA